MPRTIIRPDLKPLTPESRNMLFKVAGNQPMEVVLHYLQTEEITLADLEKCVAAGSLTADKRDELMRLYEEWLHAPDPEETEAWGKIKEREPNIPFADEADLLTLKSMIEDFIAGWTRSSYSSEANKMLDEVKRRLWDIQETEAWEKIKEREPNIPFSDRKELLTLKTMLQDFMYRWPQSTHSAEASEILDKVNARLRDSDPLMVEWKGIIEMPETDDRMKANLRLMKDKLGKMENFVRKHRHEMAGDFEDVCDREIEALKKRIVMAELESHRYDFNWLLEFIVKQAPDSVEFEVADGFLWALLVRELDENMFRKFIKKVPNSRYINEAMEIFAILPDWNRVKRSRDIFKVDDFRKAHADAHPAILDNVMEVMGELKEEELAKMKANPSAYSIWNLNELLDRGIFTVDELISEGLTTWKAYEKTKGRQDFIKDHPIMVTYVPDPSQKDDDEDITDVYLFGVPNTGKTCVLMGILSSPLYSWNSKVAAGGYGALLTEYRENMTLPERTLSNEFFCIHGSTTDSNGKKHIVNLIELAGEEFLSKLAKNPDVKLLKLEDMDSKAAPMLKNPHRKIFFIVIDPTVSQIEHKEIHTDKDENGTEYDREVTTMVSQSLVIKGMVDLMCSPVNRALMEKVDALHFISTKNDVLQLAGKDPRETMASYAQSVSAAHGLCQPEVAQINEATGYKPKLYPFSLGRFYVGNTFEYISADSDMLVNVITENTLAVRDMTKAEVIIDKVLNRKLF